MKKEIILLSLLTSLVIVVFVIFPKVSQKTSDDNHIIVTSEESDRDEITDNESVILEFDIIRITPYGDAVIAGSTEPNIEILIYDHKTKLARVTSDANGEWVWISPIPLKKGIKKLNLSHIDKFGKKHHSDQNLLIFLDGDLNTTPLIAKFLDSNGADLEILNLGNIKGLSVELVNYLPNETIMISGRMIPKNSVNFFVKNNLVGTIDSDEQGKWNFIYKLKPFDKNFNLEIKTSFLEKNLEIIIPIKNRKVDTELFKSEKIIVQDGNSLWRIARKTLGGGIYYTDIYKNNASIISDPNLIYPGQVFLIPKNVEK